MTINWNENAWFKEHHADKLTKEFKFWWSKYHTQCPVGLTKAEYWERCSIALAGWLESKKPPVSPCARWVYKSLLGGSRHGKTVLVENSQHTLKYSIPALFAIDEITYSSKGHKATINLPLFEVYELSKNGSYFKYVSPEFY